MRLATLAFCNILWLFVTPIWLVLVTALNDFTQKGDLLRRHNIMFVDKICCVMYVFQSGVSFSSLRTWYLCCKTSWLVCFEYLAVFCQFNLLLIDDLKKNNTRTILSVSIIWTIYSLDNRTTKKKKKKISHHVRPFSGCEYLPSDIS